jgi:hypothetical protein
MHPFHASLWPRAIVYPSEYEGGERLTLSWDLGRVEDKEKKDVIKQWSARLPQLDNVEGLSLWTMVTAPVFEAACQMKNLAYLQIKGSNVKDLGAIGALEKLRYLHIGSSTKVESIEPLAALTGLRFLSLENFKLIGDFSPLLALKNLETLSVGGSMWARQDVGTLETFAGMTWLKELEVDTVGVDTLKPLARLTGLEYLGIGGRLPMEEYAWLAAKLPATRCEWFGPYRELAGTGMGVCKQCKNDAMVMLTGKGAKTVCRLCDQDKVEKHAAAFNAIKQAAL